MKRLIYLSVFLICSCVYLASAQINPDMYVIGARIGESDTTDFVVIEYCLPEGPAHKSGLHPGDMIIGIDGQSVKGWSKLDIQSSLTNEKPLPVKITVQRGSDQISYEIMRARLGDIFAVGGIKFITDADSQLRVVPIDEIDTISVGSLVSPLKLQDLECNEIKLDNYKASYTLLYFWASWCPPCKFLMKKITENEAKISSAGIDIIGISLDDSCKTFIEVTSTLKPPGEQYWGNSYLFGKISHLFSLLRIGIPTAALIDKEGRLVEKATSANKIMYMIEKAIKSQY